MSFTFSELANRVIRFSGSFAIRSRVGNCLLPPSKLRAFHATRHRHLNINCSKAARYQVSAHQQLVFASTAAAAVAMTTPDTAFWIAKAKENADKNLSKFEDIAKGVNEDKDVKNDLIKELKFLEAQLKDADANSIALVPRVRKVVNMVNSLSSGNPNVLKRFALKRVVAAVNGKRDNKSYYLLDGVHDWAAKRLKILEQFKKKDAIKTLIVDLTAIRDQALLTRDQLDSRAQLFVSGLKKIHSLAGDVSGNLVEIQKTAAEMKGDPDWGDQFLTNSKDLVTKATALLQRYQIN